MTKCIPKQYICELCETTYSTRQNLWKHNKKFHTIVNTGKSSKVNMIGKPKVNINENINLNKYYCKYCNNDYLYKQSKWRHEQKCNSKDINKDDIINELKKEVEIMKNQLMQIFSCFLLFKTLNNKDIYYKKYY